MNNKKTNSKQQSKKKASSSAIIVVLITLLIAIVSGISKAAIAGAELENKDPNSCWSIYVQYTWQ